MLTLRMYGFSVQCLASRFTDNYCSGRGDNPLPHGVVITLRGEMKKKKMTKTEHAVFWLVKFYTFNQIQAMPKQSFPALERGLGILTMDWSEVREAALQEKIREFK